MSTSAAAPGMRGRGAAPRRLRPRSSGGRCVHEMFEGQADRAPFAIALVAGDERRTFAGIEARANRLAHHLRGRGVGPDSVIGLCIDRRADLVVGLLGILKAGGAYLPLDPSLPRQRLAELIGEAGARGVVTVRAAEGALPD